MRQLACLSLFALVHALLSSCAAPSPVATVTATPIPTSTLQPSQPPTSTLAETPTAIATATATEIPKPSGWENIPQNVKAVPNADGSWGISLGNEIKPIPGAVFDSTGLHLTLNTGRILDISTSELKTKLTYNQELNLLQIFNTDSSMSAEYDGGIGQPDSPDYISGQGWIDIQNLVDKACSGSTICINQNPRGLPEGSVEVFSISTGIFRKTDAINYQTNSSAGKFLLQQFVTKNTSGKPAAGWMIVQAENLQGEYIFSLYAKAFNKKIVPVKQWQISMPQGSEEGYGFLKNGNLQWWFWTGNYLAPPDYQNKVYQFFSNGTYLDSLYPLLLNAG